MKQQVKLTESELKKALKEAVQTLLKEYDPHMAGLGAARGLKQGKIGPWNAANKIMNRDRWDKTKRDEFQKGFEGKPIQQNGCDLEEYTDSEKMHIYGRPSYDEDELDDFNKQPVNNIAANESKQYKVNESQLHEIIKESVIKLLNELDWRTIDSAKEKASKASMDNTKPAGYRNIKNQQYKTFKNAVRPQMMKQYGLNADQVEDSLKGKGPSYDSASRRELNQMDKLNGDEFLYNHADPSQRSQYKDGKWS